MSHDQSCPPVIGERKNRKRKKRQGVGLSHYTYIIFSQGRIQDCHLGGRKRFCASTHAHYERGTELTFGMQGSRAPGGGGHLHIEGDGDVPLDRVCFLRSSLLAQGI